MRVIRATVASIMVLIPIIFMASSSLGQALPLGLVVDSSCHIDYLFGQQTFGREVRKDPVVPNDEPTRDVLKGLRLDVKTRLPVVDGMMELGFYRGFSARLRGMSSILETNIFTRIGRMADDKSNPHVFEDTLRPQLYAWEAAALYHLGRGGAYRFSLVGGYREEYWRFWGEQESNTGMEIDYRHTSRVPFLGFQTAMFYPLWRAKVEIVGSPFVAKVVSFNAKNSSSSSNMAIDGTLQNGGLIEVNIDGSMPITSNVTFGLSFRYSYEELRGDVTDEVNFTSHKKTYTNYSVQNLAYVGFIAGVIF